MLLLFDYDYSCERSEWRFDKCMNASSSYCYLIYNYLYREEYELLINVLNAEICYCLIDYNNSWCEVYEVFDKCLNVSSYYYLINIKRINIWDKCSKALSVKLMITFNIKYIKIIW